MSSNTGKKITYKKFYEIEMERLESYAKLNQELELCFTYAKKLDYIERKWYKLQKENPSTLTNKF